MKDHVILVFWQQTSCSYSISQGIAAQWLLLMQIQSEKIFWSYLIYGPDQTDQTGLATKNSGVHIAYISGRPLVPVIQRLAK